MSSKRYPEEFTIEAVKQVTDRGHAVADAAKRIGVPQTVSTNGPSATVCSQKSASN